MNGTYSIYESIENCHRCGAHTHCVVRFNRIRPTDARKTALCKKCAPKEQLSDDHERVSS